MFAKKYWSTSVLPSSCDSSDISLSHLKFCGRNELLEFEGMRVLTTFNVLLV